MAGSPKREASGRDTVPTTTMPAAEARWRTLFEGFARAGEDDAAIAGWSPTGLAARFRNFTRLWPGDAAGSRWLDAGCGAGTYARFLASRGVQVVGVDYSLPTLAKAKARAPAGLVFAAADVTRLPFRPESFRGALCFGVTQALADSNRAVRALCDVVEPGGEIWMDALNGSCLPNLADRLARWWKGKPPHVRYESPGNLRRIMKQCRMHHVRLYWVPILPERWARWQPLVEAPAVRGVLRLLPGFAALFSHAFVLSGRVGEARR
ncbi:MAG: methyltransferase domain-containing protein [Betaproteobacteria bacterium]|nr:methyltransferase domain-containing protein [Betaproteobacteria bacterium]